MTGKILVALKRYDRIQEITSLLQKVAKPGAKVTFLMPYPASLRPWLRDHWITTESPRKAMWEAQRVSARYSWEKQTRLAERKIAVAREALTRMGVEVAVVLKGCLNAAVRECVLTGDFQFLLMSAGTGRLAMELVRLSILWLARIHRSNFSVFRLYPPRESARDVTATAPVFVQERPA
jgi:hypothetical protein